MKQNKHSLNSILEKIKPNANAKEILDEFSIYLNNHPENLTLSEYKSFRESIENYRSLISNAVNSGQVSYDKADKVGRLLTGYIRDQHYRLLSLPKNEREKKTEKHASLYSFQPENLTRDQWEVQDGLIYELERKIYGLEEIDREKGKMALCDSPETILESIYPSSLNRFNVLSFQRMRKKVGQTSKLGKRFQKAISKLVSKSI